MCMDCILHLDHHEATMECLEAVTAYLDAIYDQNSHWSRVERYYTEYESRLLGSLMEGSGHAAQASRHSAG